jgi:hypothetical protein
MTCTFFLQELSDFLSLVYRRFSVGKIQRKLSSSSTKPVREPDLFINSANVHPGSQMHINTGGFGSTEQVTVSVTTYGVQIFDESVSVQASFIVQ